MRLIAVMLLLVLLSSFTLAEESAPKNDSLSLDFNFSKFIKSEGAEVSVAKILGGIVLAFLLISGVYFYKKRKK